MPGPLRRSRFLCLLHAAAAHADEHGTLRPRHPAILVPSIAAAAALSPDDASRYLRAALAAGLISHRNDHLALVPSAVPDWTAAAAVLARPTRALEAP